MRKIGEIFTLNNKTYTISGYHKRSYLIKDAQGKEYKVGPEKLDRIEKGEPPKSRQPVGVPAYFERCVAFSKIFKNAPQTAMPTQVNTMFWFQHIYSALSPENLSHDGELSHSQIIKNRRELQAALNYLFTLVGREVSEDEAFRQGGI